MRHPLLFKAELVPPGRQSGPGETSLGRAALLSPSDPDPVPCRPWRLSPECCPALAGEQSLAGVGDGAVTGRSYTREWQL